ncbi:cysteine proteinase [Mollisia scopiformis]|uniref:Cysteine proteinase n=1 Tax=Mollisia scopiformis TaxID=149040 RepID=A0A194WYJ7_MOLSC|nr:cysteine proteinase [Mollisia scopiformis]KUJ13041.1 cysteine proteinase [Mollisia scopiformis]
MSSEIGPDSSDPNVHETKETLIRRLEEKPIRVRRIRARPQPWIPPQDAIDKSWARSSVKIFSAATTVLPISDADRADHQQASVPPEQGQLVAANFEEAATICKQKVTKIVKEHQRVNQRYRDPHFDIDLDLKSRRGICLGTLDEPTKWIIDDGPDTRPNAQLPKSVKRVDKIFDKRKKTFSPDTASSADIIQGKIGNCWLMASLIALATMPEMIGRICVAKDEKIGVYGFVFYRDGEWIPSIIDDNLYLSTADWDSQTEYGGFSIERYVLEKSELEDKEKEHLKLHQTGSKALWGCHCRNENETWLPLLEKAYAKAHGDYYSMNGGWPGEGLEDLTGGVTMELLTSDILNEDEFWNDDLRNVKKKYLFSCATGVLDAIHQDWKRQGIEELHSYTIMEAREIDLQDKDGSSRQVRLLKLRNPWGTSKHGSWQGAWSDGSKEWTPETLKELNHQQGIDSVFWISYEDFLRKYEVIDRTHLFLEPEWRIAQQWTSIEAPWSASYHETFQFTFKKPPASDGHVVIVLSQLDDRYFRGLEGQYFFKLNFRLHSSDNLGGDDYIARSHGNSIMFRSVVAELPDLQDGTYSVVVKVVAERNQKAYSVEEVVEKMCRDKTDKYREKFSQVGLSYNMAHSKGASMMEAQIQKRKGEERRKAWKKRHEEKKRHIRKFMEKRGMVEARPFDTPPPKLEKTEKDKSQWPPPAANANLRRRRQSDQPGLKPTRASTLPAMRIASSDGAAAQIPSTIPISHLQNIPLVQKPEVALPSITEKVELVEEPAEMQPPAANNNHPMAEHAKLDHPTQQELRPHYQERDDYFQDEFSEASSEYHSDTDSVNSFGPDEEYQRLFYDPPRPTQRPEEQHPFRDDDEDIVSPWNAVCVVGLRVYSKDPDLRVDVVMPGEGEKPGLDIDDKQAGVPVESPTEFSRELPLRKLNRAFTSPVVGNSSWPSL